MLTRPRSRRQKIRLGVLFALLLLFPLTFNYYSPALPIHGALEGVACFSLLFWGVWLVSSLLLGRAGCGYFCPLGALQEIFDILLARQGRRIRYLGALRFVIAAAWIGGIAVAIHRGGGLSSVRLLFATENVVSWDGLHGAVIYGGIFGLVLLCWIPLGRRGFCRMLCFWAPLNLVGGWIGRKLRLPTLQLRATPGQCSGCDRCTERCPVMLPVRELVARGTLTAQTECILCGSCVDGCHRDAIVYRWGPTACSEHQREGTSRVASSR
jgi:ferredoxin-type protein NapH